MEGVEVAPRSPARRGGGRGRPTPSAGPPRRPPCRGERLEVRPGRHRRPATRVGRRLARGPAPPRPGLGLAEQPEALAGRQRAVEPGGAHRRAPSAPRVTGAGQRLAHRPRSASRPSAGSVSVTTRSRRAPGGTGVVELTSASRSLALLPDDQHAVPTSSASAQPPPAAGGLVVAVEHDHCEEPVLDPAHLASSSASRAGARRTSVPWPPCRSRPDPAPRRPSTRPP